MSWTSFSKMSKRWFLVIVSDDPNEVREQLSYYSANILLAGKCLRNYADITDNLKLSKTYTRIYHAIIRTKRKSTSSAKIYRTISHIKKGAAIPPTIEIVGLLPNYS